MCYVGSESRQERFQYWLLFCTLHAVLIPSWFMQVENITVHVLDSSSEGALEQLVGLELEQATTQVSLTPEMASVSGTVQEVLVQDCCSSGSSAPESMLMRQSQPGWQPAFVMSYSLVLIDMQVTICTAIHSTPLHAPIVQTCMRLSAWCICSLLAKACMQGL